MSALAQTASTLPDWPSAAHLERVLAELRERAPLVGYDECRSLRAELARVATGDALLVQGGDCAELFAEVSQRTSTLKAAQLRDLARIVTAQTGLPALSVGRIAGQFAKPRSRALEHRPGASALPVYRGDAVNGVEATPAARRADPDRLLRAYDKSAEVIGHLGRGFYTSHEALLLDYEDALVRVDPATGALYASSAHLLWTGERSRAVGGPHIDLLARIANPVAVKLGPTATARDVTGLVNRLDPDRRPGRLIFVARLGTEQVARLLPGLAEAAAATGAKPVWICDPMHANTVQIADGRKTRAVEDIVADAVGFVQALRAAGVHPGGIHLETTPEHVTECVERRSDALTRLDLPRYRTGCDPRLDPDQARRVTAAFAAEVNA